MLPVMQNPRVRVDRPQATSIWSSRRPRVPVQMKGGFRTPKAGLRLRRTRLVIALALLFAIEGTDSVSHAAGTSIHVYDLSSGREIRTLSGHNRPTTAIAVSADGSLALTASLTPELRLWSIQDGREIRSIDQAQLPGYVGAGAALQFINGTNQALVARMQAGLHLWSSSEGAMLQDFKAPFQGASAALLTPDQKMVFAIGGSESQVASWGWPKGEQRGVFTEKWAREPPCVSLARDGTARSWWKAETGEAWPEARPAPTGIQPDSSEIDQAIISPDGRRLVIYGPSMVNRNAQWVHLWDIETGKLLWHHPGLDVPMIYTFRPGAICAAIAFSHDARKLAIGRHGGRMEVRAIDGAQPRQEWKIPAGSCDRLAFLPDGQQLLTWGDKTMRIWDVGSGQLVRDFRVPVVHCLAVTPDGRFLLVGGNGEFRGL